LQTTIAKPKISNSDGNQFRKVGVLGFGMTCWGGVLELGVNKKKISFCCYSNYYKEEL
jgi:hypothetical protein